jgi:hypothetical protein
MSKKPKLEKVFLLGHVGTWSEIERKKHKKRTYVLLQHDICDDKSHTVIVVLTGSGSFVVLDDLDWLNWKDIQTYV